MKEFTDRINSASANDAESTARLVPLVYDELRQLAIRKLRNEPTGVSLQATALVHEVFLRLVGSQAGHDPSQASEGTISNDSTWQNRAHFFAAAAEAMRRILIDAARRRKAQKRGGEMEHSKQDVMQIESPINDEQLIAINDVLDRLASADPIAAELVKLRFFAGMTMKEIAEILQVSIRSNHDIWSYARAWLRRELA